MSFFEELSAFRKSIGMNQAELAVRMGISLRRLQSYEQGKCEPNLEALTQYLSLGADLNYLLTGEISPTPHQTAQIDTKQQSLPNEISADLLAQARLEGKDGGNGGGTPLVSISHRGSKQAAFQSQTSLHCTAAGSGIGTLNLFCLGWCIFVIGKMYGRDERERLGK